MSQSVLADPPAPATGPPTAVELEEVFEAVSWNPTREELWAEAKRFADHWMNFSFEERVQRYCDGSWNRRLLATAAALYPDLMPTLNGEFEWIAAFLADLD